MSSMSIDSQTTLLSRWVVASMLTGAIVGGPAPCVLADDPAPVGAPAEPTPAPTPSPTPPRPTFVAGYKNGFTLQSETGDFVLKVTGYVHADGRFAPGDEANAVTDAFLLRRIRPMV